MTSNALILLLTAASASSSPMADSVAAFSRLGPGDELRVHFRSDGFVNGATFRLVFRGSPYTVFVSRITHVDNRSQERLPTRGFTAALSYSEVAGLDALLRYYRARPDGGCATIDHIELNQVRGNLIVATESFIDRSCATDGVPGMVALPKLITRLSWADAARRHSR